MNRAERRHRTYTKWVSKIKRMFKSNVFTHNVWKVKENKPNDNESNTYDKYKLERTAILYIKNIKTIDKLEKNIIKQIGTFRSIPKNIKNYAFESSISFKHPIYFLNYF